MFENNVKQQLLNLCQMKLNIILILISVRFLGYAQEPIFFVGFETGGWVVSRINPSTKESLFAYNLNTEPRIGVLLKDKYALGIHYSYGFTRGDSINQVNYPDIHGAGVFGRFYFPFKFRRSNVFNDRLRFFSEASVSFTDYYLGPPNGVIRTNQQFETFLKGDLGFDFRYGNFHLEYSIRPIYILDEQFVLGRRLGFSYWFQKGNKEKPLHLSKNIRRNSSPSFVSHFGDRLIIGSSYTYISNNSYFDKRIKHHEFTLNVDAALNLNSRWYLGLSYKDIRTKGSTISKYKDKKENYYIVGLFTQYDFLHQNKYRLFAHVSGNYGNYCTCGDEDPYKVEGLHYLGLGMGFDYPLMPWLSIDLSGVGYIPLDKIDNSSSYTFTQYVIGLNLDIIRRKK